MFLSKILISITFFVLFTNSFINADQVKTYSTIITDSDYTFNIPVYGSAPPQNIEISFENIGSTAILNPRLTVNGKYNWYTLDSLVNEITNGCLTPEDKVKAIFRFVKSQSYWWKHPQDRTSFNPIRFFNVYGYHVCAQAAANFVALCRAIGIEARIYEIWHHTVAEAKWNGKWHHFDPDLGIWFLNRDNLNIASVEDVSADPSLVSRTYRPARRFRRLKDNTIVQYEPGREHAGEELSILYETVSDNYIEEGYDRWIYSDFNMNFSLRPNEKLTRWWLPKLHKFYDQNHVIEPPRYANGQFVFEPDFGLEHIYESIKRDNVQFFSQDKTFPMVHVDKWQTPIYDRSSKIVIPVQSPYVILGAYIDTTFYKGGVNNLSHVGLSAIFDSNFHTVTSLWNYFSWSYGLGDVRSVLDSFITSSGPQATYDFQVICNLSADVADANTPLEYPLIYGGQSGFDKIKIVTDIQLNPSSLPSLSLGQNRVHYTDESTNGKKIRITYTWMEIDSQHPPQIVFDDISPKNESNAVENTPKFSWPRAIDKENDKIVDYHFQLSLDPDCKWPLSPTFDRHLGDKIFFQTPEDWLNHKTTYYWRIRAEDDKGFLSEWSPIFNFTTD